MTTDHITVVIPTRHRPLSLDRLLRRLARQKPPGTPWDVLVVENDAPPGTVAEQARDALGALPVPARVVVESSLGAASARNRGIAEATGTIVAFIDDDVVPDVEWLSELTRPILDGTCDATGGRVVLDPTVTLPPWVSPWMRSYLSQYEPSVVEVDLSSVSSHALAEPYVLTANAAFRADVLERSGGFDPQLGPRAGVPSGNDDVQLSRSVCAVGGRMRYVPAARVVHDLPASRLTRSFFLRRFFAQGRADWLLERRVLSTARSRGLRHALELFASDLRVARAGSHTPAHRWLFWSWVRRMGFAREAAGHLVGRA